MADSPTPRIGDCVAVAFSGGLDSTALLMVTARQGAALGLRVVALHVHHGLMPEADAWALKAAQSAQQLGASFLMRRLQGQPSTGDSVEAWARKHRYQALADMAREAEATLVLLAHHAEDQAETVLLQALRGGGPAGLAAMPSQWEAHGLHWARPWLRYPREALAAMVAEAGLTSVSDPSNVDDRYARSRLRRRVWPALIDAFPQASKVLGEVARHAAHASALAQEIAALDLPACQSDQGGLRFESWYALPSARRRNVLAAWLAQQLSQGAPVALLDRLEHQWQRKGARWQAPGGWIVAAKGQLRFEPLPDAT
jgi:tRNA(Ile)-lysidine synthase